MTPTMIFTEFPDLLTHHGWDPKLIHNFIKGGALDGYFHPQLKVPVVFRASLLSWIATLDRFKEIRPFDCGQSPNHHAKAV